MIIVVRQRIMKSLVLLIRFSKAEDHAVIGSPDKVQSLIVVARQRILQSLVLLLIRFSHW